MAEVEKESVVLPPGEGACAVDAGRHEHGIREGGDEVGAGDDRVRNLLQQTLFSSTSRAAQP